MEIHIKRQPACHTQEMPYLVTKAHIIIMQARSGNLISKVGTFYLLEMENDARLLDPSLLLASKVRQHLLPPLEHIKTHSKVSKCNKEG